MDKLHKDYFEEKLVSLGLSAQTVNHVMKVIEMAFIQGTIKARKEIIKELLDMLKEYN